jgi:hypothetical protein
MQKFIKILESLPVKKVTPFQEPPFPAEMTPDNLQAWAENRKKLLSEWEAENKVDPAKDCVIAVAHLLASQEGNISGLAEEAAKIAYLLKGKLLADAVSLREEIKEAYEKNLGLSPQLKKVFEFARKVDAGELELVASQKAEGDKLGLTDSARKAAFVIGSGGGMKYQKKGTEGQEITQLGMLYVLAGFDEDGTEKTPTPEPAPAKAVEKGKGGRGK